MKVPGEAMVGEAVDLLAQHLEGDETPPYERLLDDALRGEATLFVREDAVEAAWRVVDPILSQPPPVHPYAQGTWGPVETNRLVEDDEGWHAPTIAVTGRGAA